MKKYFFASVGILLLLLAGFFANHFLSGKKETEPQFSAAKMKELYGSVKKEKKGIKGAAKWLESRLMDPATGKIDHNAILRTREAVNAHMSMGSARSSTLGLEWETLGPDNVGGRTRALLIDRNNHNKIYAGSVTGGLFVSNNGGLSWDLHPSFNQPGSQSISSIAQASTGEIYIGTGETFVYTENNSIGHLGGGIYKSSDNGATFELLSSTVPIPNSTIELWSYVSEVAVHPSEPQWVFAAANEGLMLSTDAGQNWTQAVGTPASRSREVVIAGNGIIFAEIANKYYRSSDGINFELRSGQDGFPNSNVSRMEFAVSPQDNNYVYAILVNNSGGLRGIFRSTDSGLSWTPYSPENSEFFNPLGTQGDYDVCIAVDPADKYRVWVGGQFELQKGGNLTGWNVIAFWTPRSPSNPYYVHADMHKIIFHPTDPNIAFIGTDGGVFKTESAQSQFPSFTERNKGYITTQFYNMSASITGELLAGAQDNGTSYIDFNGNTRLTADLVRGGDGGYTAFSRINQQAFFAEIQEGEILRSSNSGDSWSCWWDQFAKGIKTNCEPDGNPPCEFIAPFILWENADSGKAIFMFGGNGRVYISNEPVNFSDEPDFYRVNTPGGLVSTIEKTASGIFYVGTNIGRLFRLDGVTTANYSETGNIVTGITVTQIQSFPRYLAGIGADPNNPAHIVVTLAGYGASPPNYVHESFNANSSSPTFTSIQGDLPAFPVYSAVIDYYNFNNIIVGTDMGVWSTANGGASWTLEDNGMNSVPVFTLLQEPLYEQDCRVIYAGTYGRGMFRTTTLLKANQGNTCNTATVIPGMPENVKEVSLYPNPVVNDAVAEITLAASSDISVQVIDMSGKMVRSYSLGTNPAGLHKLKLDFSEVPAGNYAVHFITDKTSATRKIIVTK